MSDFTFIVKMKELIYIFVLQWCIIGFRNGTLRLMKNVYLFWICSTTCKFVIQVETEQNEKPRLSCCSFTAKKSPMKCERFLSISILAVFLLMGFVYYTTVFIFIENWVGLQSSAGSLNALIFTLLVSLCLFSFFVCVLTDPGRVPASYIPDVEESGVADEERRKNVSFILNGVKLWSGFCVLHWFLFDWWQMKCYWQKKKWTVGGNGFCLAVEKSEIIDFIASLIG